MDSTHAHVTEAHSRPRRHGPDRLEAKRPVVSAPRAVLSLALLGAAALLAAYFGDWAHLKARLQEVGGQPWLLVVLALAYTGAFRLRAAAWQAPLTHRVHVFKLFAALQAGLLVNHIAPLKLPELNLLGGLRSSADGAKAASRFEIAAARLWNVFNEGKPLPAAETLLLHEVGMHTRVGPRSKTLRAFARDPERADEYPAAAEFHGSETFLVTSFE